MRATRRAGCQGCVGCVGVLLALPVIWLAIGLYTGSVDAANWLAGGAVVCCMLYVACAWAAARLSGRRMRFR